MSAKHTGSRLALALIPAGLVAAGLAAQNRKQTFKGKLVLSSARITSQRADQQTNHEVGDSLEFAGVRIAVTKKGKHVLVARRPNDKPSVKVRSGKRFSWSFKGPGEKRLPPLVFHREADGAWFVQCAHAVRYRIAGVELRLIDMNMDGKFEVAADGYTIDDSFVACPLQKTMLLRDATVEILELDPAGTRMSAVVTPLSGSATQLAALRRINELRARNGLSPVVLDPELTRGCTEHADYLAANSWSGRTNPHGQTPGAPGATDAGARAATRSVIVKGSAATSIDAFWPTFYHRIGLMSPDLSKVGINATPPGISVIDVAQYRDARMAGESQWSEPAFVPADGARSVPTYAFGEKPYEPVTNLRSRGMPLMAVFRNHGGITEFSGTLQKRKGRRSVAVPVLVANRRAPEAFGIIPKQPLDSNTAYRAEFTWKDNGEARQRIVRFRTR